MIRLKFEFEIEDDIIPMQFPPCDYPAFFGEDKRGKAFLCEDPLTKQKCVAVCREPGNDDIKSAGLDIIPVPIDCTYIFDTNKSKEEYNVTELLKNIHDSQDAINRNLRSLIDSSSNQYDLVYKGLIGLSDMIEKGRGNGISDATLLSALEIVTKSKRQ